MQESNHMPFSEGALFAMGLALVPFVILAGAAAWPWTSRRGWGVLAVAVALVSVIGVIMAVNAPYVGLDGIVVVLLWLLQCLVAVAATLLDLVVWVITSRRATKERE
jgi:hypothetical protein